MLLEKLVSALMLTAAVSADTFFASLIYGCDRIKIPAVSALIISGVSGGMLTVSLLLGGGLSGLIPDGTGKALSFVILFAVGLVRLFDGAVKELIRRKKGFARQFKFSALNLNFILNVYADPEKADVDKGGVLSPMEALALGAALSADGLAAGLGAGLGDVSIWLAAPMALVLTLLAVWAGAFIGRRLSGKVKWDMGFLGGILLIALAFLRLR